jgi:hypothetical protein
VRLTPRSHYPQGQPPVPIGYEAGRAPESVWMLWRKENLVPAGNRTKAVQPVSRRYTDWATPSHFRDMSCLIRLIQRLGAGFRKHCDDLLVVLKIAEEKILHHRQRWPGSEIVCVCVCVSE